MQKSDLGYLQPFSRWIEKRENLLARTALKSSEDDEEVVEEPKRRRSTRVRRPVIEPPKGNFRWVILNDFFSKTVIGSFDLTFWLESTYKIDYVTLKNLASDFSTFFADFFKLSHYDNSEEQNTEPSQETESPEKPKKRRNLSGAVAKKPPPKRNKKPKSKEKKTADPNRERSGYVFSTDRNRFLFFYLWKII